MDALRIIVISISTLVVGTVAYCWYLGAFHKPKVFKGEFTGCKNIFYKEYKCNIKDIKT
jgi:hypothetical protein